MKLNTTYNPLITIITVVYNAASTLEQTILSVINQTYKNIEYIIIDGGSTDGTVDIIKIYENRLVYWVSEPDNGIYDAMNKGITHSTGEWVNFMNSGDTFYANTVLYEFNNFIYPDLGIDILYGDACLNNKVIRKYPEKVNSLFFLMGWMICHQAMFVRRELFLMKLFDGQYKITADMDWLISIIKNKIQLKHIPIVVCNYDIFGCSSDSSIFLKESMMIVKNHYGIFGAIFLRIKRSIRNIIKRNKPYNYELS
jgi:glycosyltransferase involved in cell wall biosynthesis